jgi:hypothetical protein
MSRRTLAALAVATLVAATGGLTTAALGAPAPTAGAGAAKAKRPTCIKTTIGDRQLCLRVGKTCRVSLRSTYLGVGLDCVRRRGRLVLARATPTALRQGRYVALGPSGQPTLAQALAAFDRSVANLPGVNPPAGTVGATTSGTTALRWMTEFRDDLTPAQRAVFAQAIAPAPDAVTIDVDPSGNVSGGPPIARAAGARAPVARAAQVAFWEQLVRDAIPRLAQHGLLLRHPVSVSTPPVAVGGAIADAYPLYLCAAEGVAAPQCDGAKTAPTACRVRIFPAAMGLPLYHQRQVVLHELTHCVEFESLGALAQLGAYPQWLSDGMAEYAAMTITQEWSGTAFPSSLPVWLRSPAMNLFRRTYDAVGFFLFLDQEGANVYGLLDPLVRASVAGDSQAAFDVAVRDVDPKYVGDWGPTLVSLENLPAWRLNQPFVPRPATTQRTVGNDSRLEDAFSRHGAAFANMNVTADILIVTTGGTTKGRMVDAANVEHPIDSQGVFCARPMGCSCPDDPGGETERYPKIPPGTTYLGMADVTADGSYTVLGQSLEDACRQRRPADDDDDGGGPAAGTSGPGLELQKLTGDGVTLVGRITSGTCKFIGADFVARGNGGGSTFLMRIVGATGPGSYVIPIGSSDTFVQIDGAVGFYTSNRPVQGFPGAGSADITRVRVRVGKRMVNRFRISVGVTPLFAADNNPGLAVIPAAGGLIC